MYYLYYSKLIDRIYMALVIYEKQYSDCKTYLNDLIFELSGNDSCQEVIQVMFRLKTIVNDDPGHTVVRKTVFDCMGLLKNLLNNIEGE